MGLTDWMPDFKGALSSFYDEKIKPSLDSKTSEFKDLVKENFARGANTQQAIIAVALGIFLLLALSFFWVDKPNGIQWKYLCLGLLTGSVSLYVVSLKPWEFSEKLVK